MLSDPYRLSCKEVVQLVTDYLEQKLLPEMQAYVEKHLMDCPGCTTYFEQIRQTIRVLHDIPENSLPLETKQVHLQAFRAWKRGKT